MEAAIKCILELCSYISREAKPLIANLKLLNLDLTENKSEFIYMIIQLTNLKFIE